MLVHARFEGTKAVRRAGAAVTLAVLLPAGAAAARETPATAVPQGPLSIAAPLTGGATPATFVAPRAATAGTCAGANRRSGTAARATAARCLVNQARARSGLRGFGGSPTLARAARNHARDMARRHYFAHQRAGGPSLMARARSAGWRGRAIGEAIAYGCGRLSTPASIVRSWLASPGHAAILMSRTYAKVGIAVVGRAPVSCGGGGTFVLDAGR
jgi:uncharacterized protein YkwD